MQWKMSRAGWRNACRGGWWQAVVFGRGGGGPHMQETITRGKASARNNACEYQKGDCILATSASTSLVSCLRRLRGPKPEGRVRGWHVHVSVGGCRGDLPATGQGAGGVIEEAERRHSSQKSESWRSLRKSHSSHHGRMRPEEVLLSPLGGGGGGGAGVCMGGRSQGVVQRAASSA